MNPYIDTKLQKFASTTAPLTVKLNTVSIKDRDHQQDTLVLVREKHRLLSVPFLPSIVILLLVFIAAGIAPWGGASYAVAILLPLLAVHVVVAGAAFLMRENSPGDPSFAEIVDGNLFLQAFSLPRVLAQRGNSIRITDVPCHWRGTVRDDMILLNDGLRGTSSTRDLALIALTGMQRIGDREFFVDSTRNEAVRGILGILKSYKTALADQLQREDDSVMCKQDIKQHAEDTIAVMQGYSEVD